MKLLIIGADAVSPEYIFGHGKKFPNLSGYKENGASCAYSAFVQKGYNNSYVSEMNWASIYTGMAPWEHKVSTIDLPDKRLNPRMDMFEGLKPFWRVLNDNGIKVGLWNASDCTYPVEINGYAVSADYQMLESKTENRISKRTIQLCEKDKYLAAFFHKDPPPRVYPKMISQQGYNYLELKKDEELAWEAVTKYHFQEAVDNLKDELTYYFSAMKDVQKKYPVDVMFFYTPTTDLIAHCCMYNDNNDVLIQAYQVLDDEVGKLVKEFKPDNVIFMSDHGMMNFKDIVNCSDDTIRHEAFGARDEALWLKNGYIAFEAHNGALLFTAHALKGTFIAAGKDIKHTQLLEMRTVDVYPTILELCGCKVPEGRGGFVLDIFNHPCLNDRTLEENKIKFKKVAIVQGHNPSITDIIVNEIYLHERFCKITLIGDKRYEEIYRNNPRVDNFVGFEEFCADDYDEIYTGYHNTVTGKMMHIQVK